MCPHSTINSLHRVFHHRRRLKIRHSRSKRQKAKETSFRQISVHQRRKTMAPIICSIIGGAEITGKYSSLAAVRGVWSWPQQSVYRRRLLTMQRMKASIHLHLLVTTRLAQVKSIIKPQVVTNSRSNSAPRDLLSARTSAAL